MTENVKMAKEAKKNVPVKGLQDAIRLYLLRDHTEDEDDAKDAEIRGQLKKIDSALADDKYFRSEFTFVNLQREAVGLLMLLRECIITHRWKPTLQLLTILSYYLPNTHSAFFKAGMEVFIQDRGDHGQLLDQFLGQLRVAEGCWNRKEIIVEFALFLMSQGEYQKAQEKLKNAGLVRKFQKAPTAYTRHWERLHKIYQGLSHYMDWWMCGKEIEELKESLLAEDTQEQEILERIRVHEYSRQGYADLALDCLRELHKVQGVWDTFILKHVELLEFRDDKDAAHEVLNNYRLTNPSNPNAARYLYEFCLRHNYDSLAILDALKNYCNMVPSDRLCLELHSRFLEIGESPGSALFILFDLLDHFQWQDEPQAWKLLSDQLQLTLTCKEEKFVIDCWQTRKSWWPAYHFRKDQAQPITEQQRECLPYRGCVATSLLGSGNQFSQSLVAQGILDRELAAILSTLSDTNT